MSDFLWFFQQGLEFSFREDKLKFRTRRTCSFPEKKSPVLCASDSQQLSALRSNPVSCLCSLLYILKPSFLCCSNSCIYRALAYTAFRISSDMINAFFSPINPFVLEAKLTVAKDKRAVVDRIYPEFLPTSNKLFLNWTQTLSIEYIHDEYLLREINN